LVAVGAPLVFVGYYEFHTGLLVCAGLALIVQISEKESSIPSHLRYLPSVCFVLIVLLVGKELVTERRSRLDHAIATSRNFFGMLTMRERKRDNPEHHHYLMIHGSIVHGLQLVQPPRHRQPTSYYGEQSGVGLALQYAPHQRGRRIGIIGLGAGTLAAFGQEGDYLRFYEIDPAVQDLAENRFTYLKESPARIDIILGDARVSLEREAPQQFDVLVIDAFSSDAIPVHLLTREAFAVYVRHLKPDGVIAMHVSNKYLDLKPVVFASADHFGLQWVVIYKRTPKEIWWEYNSTWILLTTNHAFITRSEITAAAEPSPNSVSPLLWTDAYSALFHVLKK
jgi:spermidine synthase